MRDPERRPPIFVTGYQRSGTTLLGNIIDRHPSIGVFIESFFIPRYYFTRFLFYPLARDANFLRLAHSIVEEPSARKNEMVLDEASVLALDDRTLPALVDVLFRDWARSRGKKRWADKSPGYITKLSVLDRMFPDARFVHIVRDVRDVWLSLKRLGWESDPVKVATLWRKTVSNARADGASMGSDRYHELKYEDLVTRPEMEARRISAFLGEPFDPRMIQPDDDGPGNPALIGWSKVDRAIDSGNTRKWKGELSDEEAAAFEVCAGDLLESMGYETPPVDHSLSARVVAKLREYRV